MTTRILAGDFRSTMVAAFFDPCAAGVNPARPTLGMDLQTHWFYGGLRDEDGNVYIIHRKFILNLTTGLSLMTNAGQDEVRFDPVSFDSAQGEIRRDFGDDSVRWQGPGSLRRAVGDDSGSNFEMELTDSGLRWHERDLVDLEGPKTGHGVQLYHPDVAFPMIYAGSAYALTGTVKGKPVKGFILNDLGFWPSGKDFKESSLFHELEVAWLILANEFEDGTFEFGHVMRGAGGVGAAAVTEDGKPVARSSEMHTEFVLDSDDHIGSATFSIGEHTWDFTPDPRGHCVQFASTRGKDYRAQCGVTRRRGDDRKAVRSWTWLESFPDRIRRLQSS